jgi:hypothetical protein
MKKLIKVIPRNVGIISKNRRIKYDRILIQQWAVSSGQPAVSSNRKKLITDNCQLPTANC